MKYSILALSGHPSGLLPYAAVASSTGAHRLWHAQMTRVEPHQAFAYAAGAGFRVPVGLGVTLMGLRHPYEAAIQARSLAAITGHSVVAGFGPGDPSFQRTVLKARYESPLRASREYLCAVRDALSGETVDVDGEYVSFHGRLGPMPAPAVHLGLGVLRPRMARLAGEVADAAITWMAPAAYLKHSVVPALRAGARASGRPVPWLTAVLPMAVDRPGRDPVELARLGGHAYTEASHYRDMLNRAGAGISPGDDPDTAAKALIDCGAFLNGDLGQLAFLLAEFADAGVDEVVINLTSVLIRHGEQEAMTDLKAILGEVS
ncbi:MAG: hypothetical protein QOC94_3388 [Actinoplanes sp.]|jgi:alkanesulfonate monooxygenase SsuD/methylene tetrahydromethanopterin reductase-like flavin-dependent oxidoreductase (luciferase family)|nr:hypothetical protein [Actinoplanes sp.]